MEVRRLCPGDEYWDRTIDFAEKCSWIAGKHLARMMRENRFSDWETMFIALDGDDTAGYCTFLKEDYYPENRYSPWISCIFVDERYRGRRVSHLMIATAIKYAKRSGFSKVYIPSDMNGFYEKCGFTAIDTLRNYGGDMDTIYARDI